jgi:hypothetical protein
MKFPLKLRTSIQMKLPIHLSIYTRSQVMKSWAHQWTTCSPIKAPTFLTPT